MFVTVQYLAICCVVLGECSYWHLEMLRVHLGHFVACSHFLWLRAIADLLVTSENHSEQWHPVPVLARV